MHSLVVSTQVVALMLVGFLAIGDCARGQPTPASNPSANAHWTTFESPAFRPSQRTEVQIGLPNAVPATFDRLLVQPNVRIATAVESANPLDPSWLTSHRPSAELTGDEQMQISQESLPTPFPSRIEPPSYTRPPAVVESAPPYFESLLESAPIDPPMAPVSPFYPMRRAATSGPGLGRERLAFALFDIDPAQPFNNFRIRSVLGSRMHLPDRAEYFWGKAGSAKGLPRGESVINYQEARLRMELGSKKFSTAFEVPFRATDPELNQNHAGLGDLQLITKTVMLDGKQWMLTQYFGTYFPTGNATAGLGTGHVSLEPGLLFRNELRESTWMHGELKFLFPVGADPQFGGQVLKFATGFNHVWFETDHNAWLPSIELVAFSVLNGMATDSFGYVRAIDNDAIFYLTPGLRYAVDNQGDFGLFEVGSAVSLAMSDDRFTDATWNFEMRWSW